MDVLGFFLFIYIHLGTNVLWFMNDLLCDDDNVLRYDGGVETRWAGCDIITT
jgi:hypothetical protein